MKTTRLAKISPLPATAVAVYIALKIHRLMEELCELKLAAAVAPLGKKQVKRLDSIVSILEFHKADLEKSAAYFRPMLNAYNPK